jgi:hypothetical protein
MRLETLHKSFCDGIQNYRHDYQQPGRRLLDRTDRLRPRGHDDIRFQLDQFLDKDRKSGARPV